MLRIDGPAEGRRSIHSFLSTTVAGVLGPARGMFILSGLLLLVADYYEVYLRHLDAGAQGVAEVIQDLSQV